MFFRSFLFLFTGFLSYVLFVQWFADEEVFSYIPQIILTTSISLALIASGIHDSRTTHLFFLYAVACVINVALIASTAEPFFAILTFLFALTAARLQRQNWGWISTVMVVLALCNSFQNQIMCDLFALVHNQLHEKQTYFYDLPPFLKSLSLPHLAILLGILNLT